MRSRTTARSESIGLPRQFGRPGRSGEGRAPHGLSRPGPSWQRHARPSRSPRSAVAAAAFLLALAGVACGGSPESPEGRAGGSGGTSPSRAAYRAPEGPPPDVLVIVIDALRADRLGVNGNSKGLTPAIDALASGGVNFTRAYSHSTWTKPSIATLMTSLYPSQHGLQLVGETSEQGFRVEVLVDGLVTIAERFAAAGYQTGAVVNQVHLQSRFGFGQGFEEYRDLTGKNAFELNRNFTDWFGGVDERPFFGYLHYLDAHWPYNRTLDEFAGKFGPVAMSREPSGSAARASEWAAGASADDLAALENRYDHEVAYTDRAVGQVIDLLAEAGRLDNTIVVLTSDHGEAFMEHGRLQHGYEPWEEVVHIPLVVRLPEAYRRPASPGDDAAGRTVDEPVGLVDLFPTLLDLAGLEPEPQALGQSAAALVAGAEEARRVYFDTVETIGVRDRGAKLLRRSGGELLFVDLDADPGELAPQAMAAEADCRGPCRELLRPLVEFHRLLERARASNPSGRAFMTSEEIETLRALGYVE